MNYKTDCTIVHETVIRDIIDVISGVKDSEEIQGIMNRDKSFKSISSASSNLILTFPVRVSRTVNIDNASMVTKAIERKATSLLQMLFAAINITDSKDVFEYLNKFHTNMKFDGDMTVDSFIDTLDKYVISNESVIRDRDMYEVAKKDLKNLNYYLPESISENSINEFRVYPRSLYGGTMIVNEAKGNNGYKKTPDKIEVTVNNKIGTLNTGGSSRDLTDAKDVANTMKLRNEILKNQLLDTDVKKANELVPTMMVVNFISVDDYQTPAQAIIGVKAKMYPVDSEDILTRLTLKHDDNNGLLKFIRATTREISFTRDFMFAIDKAKLDALSQSNRGSSSKFWKLLERRALKSKIRRTLGQINDASAITTLVLSQEEVDYLNKTQNINIENPKVIRPIMESYNFMGVCVVDEVLEAVKFIDDTGDDVYETLSFTHLERENTSNDYKKIINLMSKVSR